jgi:hypothetical protein
MKSVTATDYTYNPSYLQLQEQLDDLYEEVLQTEQRIKDLNKYHTNLRFKIIDLEHQAQVTLEHELANR